MGGDALLASKRDRKKLSKAKRQGVDEAAGDGGRIARDYYTTLARIGSHIP